MDPAKEQEMVCEYGKKTGNSGSGLFFEKKTTCEPTSSDITFKPGSGKDKDTTTKTTDTSKIKKDKDTTTTSNKPDTSKKYEDMTHVTSHKDKSSHNYGLIGSTAKNADTSKSSSHNYSSQDYNKNLGSSSSSKSSGDSSLHHDTKNYNKNANLNTVTSSINSGAGVQPPSDTTQKSHQQSYQSSHQSSQQSSYQPSQQSSYQPSQQSSHQPSQQFQHQPQQQHQSQQQQKQAPLAPPRSEAISNANISSNTHKNEQKPMMTQQSDTNKSNLKCDKCHCVKCCCENQGGKVTKGVFYAFTTTDNDSEDKRKSNSGIGAAHVPGKTSDQHQS